MNKNMPTRRHIKSSSLAQILVITGVLTQAAVIVLSRKQNGTQAAFSGESPGTQFQNAITEHRPILAFFHSLNCILCKEMTAIVAQDYPEFQGSIVLVDVDVYDRRNARLIQETGIHAIPTFVFYNRQGSRQVSIGVLQADQLQRKAILFGFWGLVLLVLGTKFTISGGWLHPPALVMDGKPAMLFFSLDESCECMQELINGAEAQINDWPPSARAGFPVQRIDFEKRTDLAARYRIFRVPCLILLDPAGEIVHRQDYPIVNGGPFK